MAKLPPVVLKGGGRFIFSSAAKSMPWKKLCARISRKPLEMYAYLALSILILSEGVVSQPQDVFCTIGAGSAFNGGKIDILTIDNGVMSSIYLQ